LQPQAGEFFVAELKHEVLGEALPIAVDLLVQPLGALAVELGQIGVEQHALTADDEDALSDFADGQRLDHRRHGVCPGRHFSSWVMAAMSWVSEAMKIAPSLRMGD